MVDRVARSSYRWPAISKGWPLLLVPYVSETWRGGFWFRVFGFGLIISDGPVLFSERYGLVLWWRVREKKWKPITPWGPIRFRQGAP